MGAAIKITRFDDDASTLRRFAAQVDDAEQSRRLLAIAMVMEGMSRADAARLTGMDRQTLRDWVHRYNEFGVAGLISRKPPGVTPRLTASQMQELRQLTLDGPTLEQHGVVRWRRCDLQQEIALRFGVAVCERTVGKFLQKLGLKRLQPRPFHPKEDSEAQEAFKKTLQQA